MAMEHFEMILRQFVGIRRGIFLYRDGDPQAGMPGATVGYRTFENNAPSNFVDLPEHLLVVRQWTLGRGAMGPPVITDPGNFVYDTGVKFELSGDEI